MRTVSALVTLAILLSAGARAEMPQPYIFGFKTLQIAPFCLQVSTAAIPGPSGEILEQGRYFKGTQTLWVESACAEMLRFTDMTLVYKSGDASTPRRVVFSFRKQDGQHIKSPAFLFSATADGMDCAAAELIGRKPEKEPQPLRCKSLTLGAREGIGFVHDMPLVIDWRGGTGVFLRAETDQSIPKDSTTENGDIGKKPFWDKE